MENENRIPEEEEEEVSILTLTDENGEDIDFEYLDCLTYQDKEYLVLMPADEAETLTAKKFWPFPTYGDLLFGV